MLFRRLVLCALLVGALAGLLLSAVQRWQVVPLIVAAERFEAAAEAAPTAAVLSTAAAPHDHGPGALGHDHAAHEHDAVEWAPANGAQRTAYTVLANILTATGFALLLLTAMAALQTWRHARSVSLAEGFVWGMAGYLSVYVAPAIGLPPEIPGAQSAALELRQLWWLLAVAATAGGLATLALSRGSWRWAAGGALLLLPHLIGAPQHAGLPFAGHSPAAAAELSAIAAQFFIATALANAIYWLALGGISAWAMRRWLSVALPEAATDPEACARSRAAASADERFQENS